MAPPKHPDDEVGNEEPTRFFQTPISDDELNLGEERTMAVAPEDNDALLNELLAAPMPSPLGDVDGGGAQEASVRGWSVSVADEVHPADQENRTVALDAPTIGFRAPGPVLAPPPQPQRNSPQRMLSTQPLAVFGAPSVHVTQTPASGVPRAAAPMHAAPMNRTLQTAMPPLQPPPPPPHSQPVPMPMSSAPMPPQSAPMMQSQAAQSSHALPPVAEAARKKKGGGLGLVLTFVVLAAAAAGGYVYRGKLAVYAARLNAPPSSAVASDQPAAPVASAAPTPTPAPTTEEKVSLPVLQLGAAPSASATTSGALANGAASAGSTAVAPPPQASSASGGVGAPAVGAPATNVATSDSRRKPRSDAPVAAGPGAGSPASAPASTVASNPSPKPDDPKPAADPKPAKPRKGTKAEGDKAPASTAAEEEELRKANEALSNSL